MFACVAVDDLFFADRQLRMTEPLVCLGFASCATSSSTLSGALQLMTTFLGFVIEDD